MDGGKQKEHSEFSMTGKELSNTKEAEKYFMNGSKL